MHYSRAKSSLTLLAVVMLGMISGCASITGSKTQPLSVTAVCEGKMVQSASCTLTNDKGVSYAVTPGSVVVSKSTADISVSCTKGSSTSMPSIVKSSSNASVWGNILMGGPIGAAIDAGTGAGFDYPPTINVMFSPPCDEIVTSTSAANNSPSSNPAAKSENIPQGQVADRIRDLNKLFQEGAISKSEFDTKRALLLNAM